MPLQDLKEKCAKDFWTTTVIEMVVWPPYQVDHSLIPWIASRHNLRIRSWLPPTIAHPKQEILVEWRQSSNFTWISQASQREL